MNEHADSPHSQCGWIPRHAGWIWLSLAGVILTILCTTGLPDGLTTYVMVLFLLAVAGIVRFLGRLVRLPEFATGFVIGGFLLLIVSNAVIYLWEVVVLNGNDSIVTWQGVLHAAMIGSVALLWLAWVCCAARTHRFWRQLAWAGGLCWGSFVAVYGTKWMWTGPDEDLPPGAIFPGSLVACVALGILFLAPWIPLHYIWGFWRWLRTHRTQVVSGNGSGGPPAKPYFGWPKKPAHRRPWQFGLRSMLLVMLAVSVGFGWFRFKQIQFRRQQAAAEALHECGRVVLESPESWERFKSIYWLDKTIGKDFSAKAVIWLSGDRMDEEKLVHLADFLNEVKVAVEGPLDDRAMPYIAAVRNLSVLALFDGHITDAGLVHLRRQTGLVGLYLDGCAISDEGLQHVSRLRNLMALSLKGNGLVTDAGLVHLKPLGNLSSLHLAHTSVVGPGLVHLQHLENLVGLVLDGTGVTDAGLAHVGQMPLLERLTVADTPITDAGLAHLAKLHHLGFAELQHLRRLRYLSLRGTQVTDEGLKHLAGLDQLGEIDLRGTRITDQSLACLAALPALRRLDLRGTQISSGGVAGLYKTAQNEGREVWIRNPDEPDHD